MGGGMGGWEGRRGETGRGTARAFKRGRGDGRRDRSARCVTGGLHLLLGMAGTLASVLQNRDMQGGSDQWRTNYRAEDKQNRVTLERANTNGAGTTLGLTPTPALPPTFWAFSAASCTSPAAPVTVSLTFSAASLQGVGQGTRGGNCQSHPLWSAALLPGE